MFTFVSNYNTTGEYNNARTVGPPLSLPVFQLSTARGSPSGLLCSYSIVEVVTAIHEWAIF